MTGTVGAGMTLAEAPKAEAASGNPSEILVGVDRSSAARATVDSHLSSATQDLSTTAQVTDTNDVLNYATVELSDADSVKRQTVIERLSDKPDVRYAEKNGSMRALYTPNDPEFGNQYAPQMVNAPDAWDTTFGDSSVTIAVVDQGVKYDHPDLTDNMETSVTNHGYDFVNSDEDPYPEDLSDSGEYHGTHVAGIAAAATDNATGVAGVSDASILSVRVLDSTGSGTWSDIADGIQYAADQNADVINMSLGGGESSVIKDAVAYAHGKGALLVAAAGNDYESHTLYPALHDECMSISSLNSSGSLSVFSNVGKEIELSAPGSNVLSTWVDDGYDTISGTSMATPVVAGVAALAKSQHGIGGEKLRRHLKETAADIGLPDGQQGAGRVDAHQAVTTAPKEQYHGHLGEAWSGVPSSGEALGLEHTATSGNTRGLDAAVHSGDGNAVRARNHASTGIGIGVWGRSDSENGNGIFGYASNSSGYTYGLRGESESTQGTGLYGKAKADSGTTKGVRGASLSPGGYGVSGENYAGSGDAIGVYGKTESPGGFAVYADGDLHVQGNFTASGSKDFVQTVSTDAGPKEIAFTAVEADQAHTETSGVVELRDGRAEIELPEHFAMVTAREEELTVQVSPYSTDADGPAVTDHSVDRIVLEDLEGTGTYEVAYTVKGVREGYEDKEVVREAGTVSPDEPSVPDLTE